MNVSRRSLLVGGASLAAVGSVPALALRAPAASAPTPATPLNKLGLRRSTFLPLVGQRFRIVHDRGSSTVVLRQISDLMHSARPGAEDQFSLIFTGAKDGPAIRQGIYSISHARQGQFSLFLAPVGGSKTAQIYEAIIDSRPLSTIR